MIVEIAKVSKNGSEYEGEESPSILEIEGDRLIRAEEPVRYRLFVEIVSHELVVRGEIGCRFEVYCSKCADLFSTTVSDSSFLRAYALSEGIESVDLTSDIREGILLLLPSFPVCSPSCPGLCPACGKNLKEGPCTCGAASGDEHWSALDRLDL